MWKPGCNALGNSPGRTPIKWRQTSQWMNVVVRGLLRTCKPQPATAWWEATLTLVKFQDGLGVHLPVKVCCSCLHVYCGANIWFFPSVHVKLSTLHTCTMYRCTRSPLCNTYWVDTDKIWECKVGLWSSMKNCSSRLSWYCHSEMHLILQNNNYNMCKARGRREGTGEEPSNVHVHIFTSAVDCGTLNNPANGQVSYTGRTTFGWLATYSCNTGYSLVGGSTCTYLPSYSKVVWECAYLPRYDWSLNTYVLSETTAQNAVWKPSSWVFTLTCFKILGGYTGNPFTCKSGSIHLNSYR